MSFQIVEPTKAKLKNHDTLSDKNRKEGDEPGLGFNFEMTVPNSVLSQFAPGLREFIYTKTAGTPVPAKQQQQALEGVQPVTDLPNLSSIGSHLPRLPWHQEFTGMQLGVLFGTTLTRLPDCLVHKFRFQPKEGGSVLMSFRVEAPNVAEKFAGVVPKMKSREVEITLEATEVAQSDLDDEAPARTANTKPKVTPPKVSPPKGTERTPEQALAESLGVPG